jgi:hypothetical protein
MIENKLDTRDSLKLADKQQDLLINDNIDGNNFLSDDQDTESIDNLFFIDSQALPNKNNRVTTRIIRDGITVKLKSPYLFCFTKTISVELIDISCKGVLISTHQKLRINQKITLTLLFDSGKLFEIKAMVVRCSDSPRNEYGIKFVQNNNELGDSLYESQERVTFK